MNASFMNYNNLGRSAKREDENLVLRGPDCGFDDRGEGISFQACSTHQCSVDVWMFEKLQRVIRLDAAAILDDDFLSDNPTVELADELSNELMDFLRLLWRRVFSSPNGPDGFISYDDFFHV